jgi:protein-S-isoprenylcysteine O-methyltransferase Ste14
VSPKAGPGPLFWRALLAFLALPGVVALLVPWLMTRSSASPFRSIALVPLSLGALLLLWCVREFYVAGRGTLAPWSPPRHLVVSGPYRFSRNPMYVAVLLSLVGWAVGYSSRALWIYAAFVAVAFQLRIVFGEEPWLARTHGEQWQAYRARVGRWVG